MKYYILLFFLSAVSLAGAVDLNTQKKFHETEDFVFYSEDSEDYSELVELVVQKNRSFQKIFNIEFNEKISIYIFKNQISFSQHVFNSDKPVMNATGLADHVRKRFFLTSFYDTCKTRERLLQTPVHELVHLYFPCSCIWIREGIACYYADMLFGMERRTLPGGFSEMIFYEKGAEETRKAYNASGWLVKYIIEELCGNDISYFRSFSKNPENYKLLGVHNENELFGLWNDYMIVNRFAD